MKGLPNFKNILNYQKRMHQKYTVSQLEIPQCNFRNREAGAFFILLPKVYFCTAVERINALTHIHYIFHDVINNYKQSSFFVIYVIM
jgi:hypothetical protein